MNKLLSLIIIVLLIVVGYLLIQKPSVEAPIAGTDTLEQIIAEEPVAEIPAEDSIIVGTSTDELAVPAAPFDFCADLKAGIPGSDEFHITIDVASGETLTDGSMIRGCVYSIDESYSVWGPFEGQVATYELTAPDGTVLDTGFFQTVNPDWLPLALGNMDIEYTSELSFDPLTYTSGTLMVMNENPSGEPALAASFTVPVSF